MRPVRTWVLWLVAGLLGLADAAPAHSQKINPPFGLHWAEGQKKLPKSSATPARVSLIRRCRGPRGLDDRRPDPTCSPADDCLLRQREEPRRSRAPVSATRLGPCRLRGISQWRTPTVGSHLRTRNRVSQRQETGGRRDADGCRIPVAETVRQHPTFFLFGRTQ